MRGASRARDHGRQDMSDSSEYQDDEYADDDEAEEIYRQDQLEKERLMGDPAKGHV